jgi:hypothetical protein
MHTIAACAMHYDGKMPHSGDEIELLKAIYHAKNNTRYSRTAGDRRKCNISKFAVSSAEGKGEQPLVLQYDRSLVLTISLFPLFP